MFVLPMHVEGLVSHLCTCRSSGSFSSLFLDKVSQSIDYENIMIVNFSLVILHINVLQILRDDILHCLLENLSTAGRGPGTI